MTFAMRVAPRLSWWMRSVVSTRPRRREIVIDLPDLLFEVHSWTGFLDA